MNCFISVIFNIIASSATLFVEPWQLYYFFNPIQNRSRASLWSSGQSSWLQIRRPEFDFRHYQKKSNESGTGSTQEEELLDRKVAAPI
jgi:hypothetical protein